MRGGGQSGRSHVLFFAALSYFPKRRVYSSVPPPRRCQNWQSHPTPRSSGGIEKRAHDGERSNASLAKRGLPNPPNIFGFHTDPPTST